MTDPEQQQPVKPRVAFISGHIDLTQKTFNEHYKAPIDAAIASGDSFIVSSSRGVDTSAFDYLLAANVPKEKITVYLNTHLPPEAFPKPKSVRNKAILGGESANQTDRRDLNPKLIQRFSDLDVAVTVMISGDHTKHDTVMTKQSDYDILWVRSEEETQAMYGSKYRKGRVSGTEKNRLRRKVIATGREAMRRRGIGGVKGRDEEEGEGGE